MHLVVPPGGAFREARRIELGPRPLTIGRGTACDIRLDVPGVDDEHAKVSEVALVAVGPDCAVGDVPLEPGARRLLMPGDELQIGSVVLALEGDDPSLLPPPVDGSKAAPGAPRLRVVEGPNFGDELVMGDEGRLYTIGRGPKCDLVLEDREVSREHVTVQRRGFNVYVKDQSSTRGSWLGRAAVYQGSSIEWKRPSMLKLGATVLSLDLPEAYRRVAAPAQASAGMTPPPRQVRPKVDSTPTIRDSEPVKPVAAPVAEGSGPAVATSAATPLPTLADDAETRPAPPVQPLAPSKAKPDAQNRKAWKKSGPSLGRAGGIALLAVATVAIVGAIFVVFSLIE